MLKLALSLTTLVALALAIQLDYRPGRNRWNQGAGLNLDMDVMLGKKGSNNSVYSLKCRIEDLEKENKDLKQENFSLQIENVDLKDENVQLKETVTELEANNKKIKEENNSLKLVNEALEAELKAKDNKIADIESQHEKLTIDYNNLSIESINDKQKIAEIEKTLENALSAKENIAAENAELKDDLNAANDKIYDLKAYINNLRRKLRKLKAKLKRSLNVNIGIKGRGFEHPNLRRFDHRHEAPSFLVGDSY